MLLNTRQKFYLTKYLYLLRSILVPHPIRGCHKFSENSAVRSSCIRKAFIDYFKYKHGHVFVPSSSTIPHNDNTLLFANAGMNQFKEIFQGTVFPDSSMSKYRRVVNSQKCVRVGGKHNDLDQVGRDCYHHTFFEMLGNWAFVDYFKEDAIHMAWDLLTNIFKLPEDCLYVTYFKGDNQSSLSPDLETKAIWQQLGLPEDRVLPFGSSENFWEMGNTGPCGPCTEIHFDRLGNRDASALVNQDDPDVIELWNLVFTQYDRDTKGKLHKLPSNNVDTGMGLERLVSVLQGVTSNYDTDLFRPLIASIEQVSGVGPYEGKVGISDTDGIDMAYRVLADHARMLTICITDGARPGPQMQGYVIKRIIRRATRYAVEKLKAPPGTIASLVPVVVHSLGGAFPELTKNPEIVMQIINQEEQQFLKTLEKGKRFLQKHISKLGSQKTLSGEVAWKMYDSFGYPIDLTNIIASENNLKVDMEEYEEERRKSHEITSLGGIKNQQKKRMVTLHAPDVEWLKNKKIPVTNTSAVYATNYSESNSYYSPDVKTRIIAIKAENNFVDEVGSNVECGVITSSTNFYAESGGQIADIGVIINDQSLNCLNIDDVQSYGGYSLHSGMSKAPIRVGVEVHMHVNWEHRINVMRNHTGTHLLNFALREVLSNTSQKGSLVASDRLRFDFNSMETLSTEDLQNISDIVNRLIQESLPLYTSSMSIDKANTIPGLQAVFGETYGDEVRVVTIGQIINELMSSDYTGGCSVELCGGTHVENTSHIEKFIITSQKASSSGVRRLEAVTGAFARKAESNGIALQESFKQIQQQVSSCLQNSLVNSHRLLKDLESLAKIVDKTSMCLSLKTKLRQEISANRNSINKAVKTSFKLQVNEMACAIVQSIDLNHGRKYHIHHINSYNEKKEVSSQRPCTAIMLLSSGMDRLSCYTLVPKELIQVGVKANEWALAVNHLINGKGGGTESLCCYQGNMFPIDQIIAAAEHFVSSKVARVSDL
ncbi:alanine--tRNA ligase, cytoplasmic-like isoform X2 [Anneissia japonica]|uniref:alanine--tRNA ligase, cytoplasmic-like isoform X2 n=1 Tax=Anneissia japonica TaxID=1529436 RepID=UPI0014257F32|nr:alanine--tRNA ligase, cytoplasmic-like isoform X2 [Anneissia japonica]